VPTQYSVNQSPSTRRMSLPAKLIGPSEVSPLPVHRADTKSPSTIGPTSSEKEISSNISPCPQRPPPPDGSRVAFESDSDPLGTNPEGDGEIFVMNADGTGVTQLTRNEGVHDEGPAWAPDGTQITYTSGPDNTHGDINVVTAAGIHLRRLTDFEGADESPDWQAIPAAETDRRCGDAGVATDVRAAGRGLHCAKARRLAERWSGRGMPDSIRRFDAVVDDFGGTLRVELVRRHGRRGEQLVTFLHPRFDRGSWTDVDPLPSRVARSRVGAPLYLYRGHEAMFEKMEER